MIKNNSLYDPQKLSSIWDPRDSAVVNTTKVIDILATHFELDIREGIYIDSYDKYHYISNYKKSRSQKDLEEIFKVCEKVKAEEYIPKSRVICKKLNNIYKKACHDYHIFRAHGNLIFIIGKKGKTNHKKLYETLSLPILQFSHYLVGVYNNNNISKPEIDRLRIENEFNIFFNYNEIASAQLYKNKFVNVNAKFSQLTNYSSTDLSGKTDFDLIDPAEISKVKAEVKKLEKGITGILQLETSICRKDGGMVRVNLTLLGIYEKSKLVGRYVMLQDITKITKIQKEKLLLEKRYKSIFEQSTVGIIIVRKDLILHTNPYFIKLLGYNPSESNPTKLSEVFEKEVLTLFSRIPKKISQSKKKYTNEKIVEISTTEGKSIFTLIKINPVYNSNNVLEECVATFTDVTTLKENEKKIEQVKHTWKSIVDNNTFGIVEVKYGEILYCNEAFRQLTGYNNAQLLKMSILDLLHPEYLDVANQITKKILNREVDKISFVGKLIHKNKKVISFFSSIQGVFTPDGTYINSVFTLHDITEENENRVKLQHSQAKYKTLVETSPSGIIQLDLKSKIIFSSVSAVEILGYTYGDFTKKKALQYIHKDDRNNFKDNLNKVISTGEEIEGQFRAIHYSGKPIIIEGKLKLLLEHDKTPSGILIVFNDVTKKVRAENELIERQSTLKAILQSTERNIIAYDANLNILNINKAAIRDHKILFGMTIKIGLNAKQIYSPKKLQQNKKNYYNKVLQGQSIDDEMDFVIKEQKYTFKISFEPIKDSDNNIIGILETASDVTKKRQEERELTKREATLKAVLDSTPNGIYALDKAMNIIAINRQAIKDFNNYGNNVKLGDNLYDIIDKEILTRWRELYFEKVFEGDTIYYSGLMTPKKEVFVENTYSPVISDNGEIIGCLEISIDVSEQKSKEQALSDSEKRYKMLLETSPSAILQISKTGNILFSNKRVGEIHNINNKELFNKTLRDLTNENFTSKLLKSLSLKRKTQKDYFLKTKATNVDGELLFIEGFWNEIKDDKGNLDGALLAYNDVTERVLTEIELTNTRQYYEKMYHNMFDSILTYNYISEKIIDCNKAAIEVLGYKRKKDLLLLNAFDLIPKQSPYFNSGNLQFLFFKHKEAVLNGKKFRTKGVFLTKNGDHIYCDVYIIPTYRNEGEAFIIIHDITTEELNKQAVITANEKVRERTAIYEALIENSSDGIDVIQFDKKEDNSLVNPRIIVRNSLMDLLYTDANRLYTTLEEIIMITNHEAFEGKKELKSILKDKIRDFIKTGELRTEWHLNKEGSGNISIDSSHKIFNIEDKTFMVRNYRDITERTQQQEIIQNQLLDLNKKNEELKKYIDSNLQLENFAYIASHDLKAPLRSVSSFAHLLKDKIYDNLSDKERSFLDIILSSSRNMQLLIDDLLDFSRVNTWKIRMRPINMMQLFNRLKRELISDITDSKAIITVKEMPTEMMGDETLLFQLFQNLIKNAIKFQSHDSIPEINISGIEKDNNLKIIVSDNGIGIKKEHQKKIFGIFEKLYSSEIYEGTGLGLTICKKITERLGGSISVESDEGKGSSFIIKLPLKEDVSNK